MGLVGLTHLSKIPFSILLYWYQWRPQKIFEGEPKGPCPPNFLENLVILCFERRFSKQNSVIRLKFNILVIHCRILTVYTAEYCMYIFLVLGSEEGHGTVAPPPYASDWYTLSLVR